MTSLWRSSVRLFDPIHSPTCMLTRITGRLLLFRCTVLSLRQLKANFRCGYKTHLSHRVIIKCWPRKVYTFPIKTSLPKLCFLPPSSPSTGSGGWWVLLYKIPFRLSCWWMTVQPANVQVCRIQGNGNEIKTQHPGWMHSMHRHNYYSAFVSAKLCHFIWPGT